MAVAAPLSAEDIASLEAAGLGHIGAKVQALLDRQAHDRHEIEWRDAKIEKLTFEMAQLRRVKFGKKSEQLGAEQKALFDEAVDADLHASQVEDRPVARPWTNQVADEPLLGDHRKQSDGDADRGTRDPRGDRQRRAARHLIDEPTNASTERPSRKRDNAHDET